MKKLLLCALILLILGPLWSDEEEPSQRPVTRTLEEQRLDTLRFGTETEIASLIQTVRNEKVTYLDEELIGIANRTRNRNILTGIFNLFAEMEQMGLEERATRAILERDNEANETVVAAVDYLGRAGAVDAIDVLEELINSEERRFLNNAFRALGRISKEADALADRTALFLLDFYEHRNPGDDNRREIIVALGETGSKEAVSFLSNLAGNADERFPLRMVALDALSKIADENGLDVIIEAVNSPDPNIRSTAVAALGPFSGEAVDNAILEAFRDSFFRTRIGAAQAAGRRQLESAVPFLRFRAENDEVPAVRDEAIRALGAIANEESIAILNLFFTERRNSDRVRLVAAEMLLQNDADTYATKAIIEMDEAKNRNQTALYNGFVRMMGSVKSDTLESFARRLTSVGGVIEKSLALDIILTNEFRSLEDEMRSLLNERIHSASIARKARTTLERLGFELVE